MGEDPEEQNREWIRLVEVAMNSGLGEDQGLVHWASSNSLAPKADDDIRTKARVLHGASLLTGGDLEGLAAKMANSSVEKSKSMTTEEIQRTLEDTCCEALEEMVETIVCFLPLKPAKPGDLRLACWNVTSY